MSSTGKRPPSAAAAAGQDRLYLERDSAGSDFQFDAAVAAVFDNMISRSVPQYDEVQRVTVELARSRVRPQTSIVDIGCATGTTLLALAGSIPPGSPIIGIEPSAPMLDQCRFKLAAAGLLDRAQLICADAAAGMAACSTPPSVVILNYTLQFIPPERRTALLQAIFGRIGSGGCLILSEKVRAEDPEIDSEITGLHLQFKRANGYSDLEISRKRDALEQVLIPWTVEQNRAALAKAGFSRTEIVLKSYQFTTFLAVK